MLDSPLPGLICCSTPTRAYAHMLHSHTHTHTRIYSGTAENCKSRHARDRKTIGTNCNSMHVYISEYTHFASKITGSHIFKVHDIYPRLHAHSPGMRRGHCLIAAGQGWPRPPHRLRAVLAAAGISGQPACVGSPEAVTQGVLGVGQVPPQPSRSLHPPLPWVTPPVNKDEDSCLPNSRGCSRGRRNI